MASEQLYGDRPDAGPDLVAVSRYIIAFVFLVAWVGVSPALVLYEIDLYNNTNLPVELVDVRTHSSWATIEPGRSKRFIYWEGVTLRIGEKTVHFNRVDPPKVYMTGLFSITFSAQLNPDMKIYALLPGTQRPVKGIRLQPRGFPLSPSKS